MCTGRSFAAFAAMCLLHFAGRHGRAIESMKMDPSSVSMNLAIRSHGVGVGLCMAESARLHHFKWYLGDTCRIMRGSATERAASLCWAQFDA